MTDQDDSDDERERRPFTCVDEHGSPTVMTDGGYNCRWTGECRRCGKPVATRTEGDGENEHCARVRCSACGATNYLTSREDLGPLRADGGRPEGVSEHPDGFHSGTHYLDDPAPEPATDPSNWCYECGDEAHAHRCICGMPLCHRHHETQAGFCSDHTHVRTRVGDVPACIRPDHDGGLEVLVDAPMVNYARPARQRLPPSEIEQAVRSRLPDALLVRAQEHVQDALALDDHEWTDRDDAQKVIHADDTLAWALAADDPDRRDGWLRTAYRCIDDVRESLSTDEWGLAMDLRLAAGLLEQLGADRGGEVA
jgi:hypothetical protein